MPQELIGDLRGVSQSTVSRIVAVLVPIVHQVLAEFVPSVEEAIELVEGRACLVDGTITPCWSYETHADLWSRKKGITGFNVQLVGSLRGEAIYISDPLPGKTHDAAAFTRTPVANIVAHSGGVIADSGYQGHVEAVPRKKPKKGELSKGDKEGNAALSRLRAAIERLISHFKAWRILHTDYRRPYNTYHETFNATRALFFFSINWSFE